MPDVLQHFLSEHRLDRVGNLGCFHLTIVRTVMDNVPLIIHKLVTFKAKNAPIQKYNFGQIECMPNK